MEHIPDGETVQSKNRIDPPPCIQNRTASGSITVRADRNLAYDKFAVRPDAIFITARFAIAHVTARGKRLHWTARRPGDVAGEAT